MASCGPCPPSYTRGGYEKFAPEFERRPESWGRTAETCPWMNARGTPYPANWTNWNREAYPNSRYETSPYFGYGNRFETTPFSGYGNRFETSPYFGYGNRFETSPYFGYGNRFETTPFSGYGNRFEATPFSGRFETTPFSGNGNRVEVSPFSGNNWNNWFNSFDRFFNRDFDRSINIVEKELDGLKKFFSGKQWNELKGDYNTSLAQTPSRPTSSLEYYTFMNPIFLDSRGNRFLRLCFDLCSFKPEEVRVTLYAKDKYIEVEASHDVKDSKEHTVKRTYCRKYYFPTDLCVGDVAKLELKSYMTNEGQLFCEALLPHLTPEESKVARQHLPCNVYPVKTEKKDF